MSWLLLAWLSAASLQDPDPRARVLAYRELAEAQDSAAAVEQIAAALSTESDPQVRAAGQDALSRLDLNVDQLAALLGESEEPIARAWAAHSLGRHGPLGVDALLAAVEDTSPQVRGEVYDALARSGDPRALQALRRAAVKDPSALLRERASQAALQVVGRQEVQINAELARLGHPDPGERVLACKRLGQAGDWRALQPLLDAAKAGDPIVREAAILALGQLGDHRAVPELEVLATQTSGKLRYSAIAALAHLADESAVPTLTSLMQDPDPATRQLAVRAVSWTDPAGSAALFLPLLADPEEAVRLEVIGALGQSSDPERAAALITALADPSPFARAEAARLLSRADHPRSIEALTPLLKDRDPLVRLSAAASLQTLGATQAAPAIRKAAEKAPTAEEKATLEAAAAALGG